MAGNLLLERLQSSSVEKRTLAHLPALPKSRKELQQFPSAFENYYKDHFGFREWLVSLYNMAKYKLGDSPSDNVIRGREGWLFLGGDKYKFADPIGDYRNINTYTIDELHEFSAGLEAKYYWLKEKGIRYVFTIAPNKHTIYPEYLPSYIKKARDNSAYDQIVSYAQQYTEVPVVDLRPALLTQKNSRRLLYFRTGTHWNAFGANFAQYELAKAVAKFFPEQIMPILYKKIDFSLVKRPGVDLANFIGMQKNFVEEEPSLKIPTCSEKVGFDVVISRQPFSTSCEKSELKALIFRDSFFTAVQPFFSEYFNSATYVWKRIDFATLQKFVNKEKPDVVIEEWVERTLPLVPKL